MNYSKIFLCIPLFLLGFYVQAQDSEVKSIDQVIQGIDSLLDEIDRSNETPQFAPNPISQPRGSFLPSRSTTPPANLDGSFRVENELMPSNLRQNTPEVLVNEEDINPDADIQPTILDDNINSAQISPIRNLDYTQASLEDLLREVDLLELPEFEMPLDIRQRIPVEPIPEIKVENKKPTENLLIPEVVTTPLLDPEPVAPVAMDIEEYTVLGEQIDQELREKIREAIMQTRLASGGSSNPFVTRTVFKATAYCNKILGRLNAPHHKRYRRDILLSLIRMHERNQAWVDTAKTYERYLEEFASDDNYPFEDHEDAPGIPDLRSGLGSVEKWLEGGKRGAPTIPETHVRLGKIYRSLGAHRMALNKFYDAINATLTLPQNEAFELAERGDGRTLENRMDAESNQAMFEIAETFMDAEDYNNAIKFFDRLMRLEQLQDTDRAVVRFKQGLAHYRRARENLRKEEVMKRKPVQEQEKVDVEYDQTPRADFAKVKETLRGYGTLYPQSPYVPESHYLLALTYEQLNQDEESVLELLSLLKESYFNPKLILNLEQGRDARDRDYQKINQLKSVWNFWKKKTGNYLANKFFEDAEYFNAYRVYSALRDIDNAPSWQLPIMYQLALCEEKLGNYVDAMETYSSIEEYVNSAKEAREDMANSKYLNFVFGMAKWRKEQLEDTRAIRQAVSRYGIYTVPSAPSDPELVP